MKPKRFLRVRNFEKFQHYKQRNPIWIKIYSAMLDDYDFQALPDATKFHAVGLMLLASRLDNVLPIDADWLAAKIGAKSEINLDLLIENDFLEFAESSGEEKKEEKPSAQCAETEETLKSEITSPKSNNGHKSQFSMLECLKYVEIQIGRGEPIRNKHGLATHLLTSGVSDSLILAELYPERAKAEDAKIYGEPIRFSNEPCSVCFGAKMEITPRGARGCDRCKNERGKSTGKEPAKEEEVIL